MRSFRPDPPIRIGLEIAELVTVFVIRDNLEKCLAREMPKHLSASRY